MQSVNHVNMDNTRYVLFDKTLSSNSKHVIFSNYIKKASKMIQYLVYNLKETLIEEPYILCPIYGDPSTGEMSDIQIGVTGSAKYGERTVTAVNRELAEELGIFFPPYNLETEYRFINHQSDPSLFAVSASKLGSVKGDEQEVPNSSEDDRSRKICVIVFSNLENVDRLFSSPDVSKRFSDNEKDIIGMAAVNIIQITNFIKKNTRIK